MKLTFFLNTSQERFCGWLYHHLEEDSNEGKLDFATKEAGLALKPGTDVVPLPSTRIVLWATPIPPSGEEPDLLELVSSTRTVIYFWVHPLTGKRVEVTAECNEPAVENYFKELLSRIAETWEEASEAISRVVEPKKPEEKAARPLPDYFPKTEKARKRWRDAYSIIKKLQREYRTLYRDGDTKKPKPTFDEYRERLGSSKLAWTPSDKTIRRIIHCGDEGLLK